MSNYQNEMPAALEAEASLLGNILFYGEGAQKAIDFGLHANDFYSESHQRIFAAMEELYKEGLKIDSTTVAVRLREKKELDRIGGETYLNHLLRAAVTNENADDYIALIHDKALMRRMIEVTQGLAKDGMERSQSVNDFLDDAERQVLEISRRRRTDPFHTATEIMNDVVGEIQNMSDNRTSITGLKTGYTELDRVTHGFQPGDLIILAARPSMGKTAVALNLALHSALYQPDKAVAIFSLEMSARQLGMRLLTSHSRVDGNHIRTGYLNNDEWSLVNEATTELKTLNLYVDESSMIRMPEIFSKCHRLATEKEISLIVVDYIQLIRGNASRGDYNRQQEVSDISRNLKALARDLNVPVLALSQLSRNVELREDKKPMLSDLRESGAIEQDADVVMLLYRDSYYNEEAKKLSEETGTEILEINIAKHRNGATRRVNVVFEPKTTALMNLERQKGEEEA